MSSLLPRVVRAYSSTVTGNTANVTHDPVQLAYMTNEQCIAVDEEDRIVGALSKGDSHRVPQLPLHRAFSVFAFTPDRKLILQRRSTAKITFPNLWTNTCCSHPLYNDVELDGENGIQKAAARKLDHELGMKSIDPDRCRVVGRFHYKAQENEMWGEHEMDYAVILRDVEPSTISMNEEEVCDVRLIDEEQLQKWMSSSPSSFTPWFQLFARLTYLNKWWHSLDNIDSLRDMNIVRMK